MTDLTELEGYPPNWCFIDDRSEPDGFRRCGECGHAWPTSDDLLADWKQMATEMRALGVAMTPISDVDDIGVCPLCTHDW